MFCALTSAIRSFLPLQVSKYTRSLSTRRITCKIGPIYFRLQEQYPSHKLPSSAPPLDAAAMRACLKHLLTCTTASPVLTRFALLYYIHFWLWTLRIGCCRYSCLLRLICAGRSSLISMTVSINVHAMSVLLETPRDQRLPSQVHWMRLPSKLCKSINSSRSTPDLIV